jgi:predicted ribosome quality control (RQC) complex YloA/Tae2 family protein
VPDEWTPFIDKRRKLSWNIEQCFTKARETEGKLHGTEQRKAKLLSEISKLEQESRKPKGLGEPKPQMVADDPLKNSGVDGRSFKINQEVTAFAGKNAADNMKLLRRARPWDFWLHVQDQPSAHVIVFRNKSTSVSDAVLRDIIGWMLKLQLGPKLAKHSKEKFKVIVAECRHVRSIKGDRLGRVHYQNERILIYQIP